MRRGTFISLAARIGCLFLVTASSGPPPPSLTAQTDRPGSSLYGPGDPVTVTFAITGMKPRERFTLDLLVRDEYGNRIAASAPALAADEGGNARYAFAAPHPRFGYYEVAASLPDGTVLSHEGTRPSGFISYAVIDDPRTRVDYGPAKSRFGMQGGFNRAVPLMPWLGLRYYLSGTSFAAMEPNAPGQFDAERARMRAQGKPHPDWTASIAGAQTVGGQPWRTYPIAQVTSAKLPAWALLPGTAGTICKAFGALNDKGGAALTAFAEAEARAFVEDFPDQSPRIYQMTWEPADNWCFGGSPEQLVEFYRRTYAAIHRIDPNAVIAGPTLFPEKAGATQYARLWAAGLGQYLDAFSIHPYSVGLPVETHGFPDYILDQLDEGERAAGHKLGFLGTEHGARSQEVGNLGKAQEDLRITLILLGEGAMLDINFYAADFWGDNIDKVESYGFFWNLNPTIRFGTDRLGPKAIAPAYAAMTRLIDGSDGKGVLPGLKGTQAGYRFVRGRTTIDAVWDYGGGTSSYLVPRGARVCDWMGNCGAVRTASVTVNGSPTYLVTDTALGPNS